MCFTFHYFIKQSRQTTGLACALVLLVSVLAIPNSAEAGSPQHSAPATGESHADPASDL